MAHKTSRPFAVAAPFTRYVTDVERGPETSARYLLATWRPGAVSFISVIAVGFVLFVLSGCLIAHTTEAMIQGLRARKMEANRPQADGTIR